jgi:PEGA domain
MPMLRRLSIALVLLLAAGSLLPASAAVRLGGVSVGAGYAYGFGPFWPGHPFGFYGPWFLDAFYGPVILVADPARGQVNLQSPYKDADVYLDDAYAGTTSTLKKFWLAPGVYQLEVRPKGRAPQTKRIYVLTGKTLKVSLE